MTDVLVDKVVDVLWWCPKIKAWPPCDIGSPPPPASPPSPQHIQKSLFRELIQIYIIESRLFIIFLFYSMKCVLLSDDGFTVTHLYCLTVLYLYYYFAILTFTVIFTVSLLLFYYFMIFIETTTYYRSHIVCYILYVIDCMLCVTYYTFYHVSLEISHK